MKTIPKITGCLFIALSCIALFLGALLYVGRDDSKTKNQIDPTQGMNLIRRFYAELLSENSLEECADLFDVSPEKRDTDRELKKLTEKWKYLRKNKRLFFTEQFSKSKFHSEKDFVDKARKGYWYFNPPKEESITGGWLFITLSSTLSKEQDGVWKDIAFPIVRDEETNVIKLGFYGIRINGVLLDPEGTTKRNYNLFDRLGFGRPQ